MKITSLLDHDIQRGNVVAWKKDETLAVVKNQMSKNNIRFVRYSYCQKGELFKQELLRKGHGQVPRKKGLDVENYGGYQKSTITYYLLAKYKKGKNQIVTLIPVDLRFAVNIRTFEDKLRFCSDYVERELKAVLETVLLGGRKIKINALFEIDGFRAHLSGRTGSSVVFKCGMQLIVPREDENYIKKLSSYFAKYQEAVKFKNNPPKITKYDKITAEQNIALYDLLTDKLKTTAYGLFMGTVLEHLEKNREYFCGLDTEIQSVALYHIVELFGCSTSTGKDLSLINESNQSGIIKMTLALSKKRFSEIRIIDQSPTGLIEHRSENLLEL